MHIDVNTFNYGFSNKNVKMADPKFGPTFSFSWGHWQMQEEQVFSACCGCSCLDNVQRNPAVSSGVVLPSWPFWSVIVVLCSLHSLLFWLQSSFHSKLFFSEWWSREWLAVHPWWGQKPDAMIRLLMCCQFYGFIQTCSWPSPTGI